MLGILRDSPVEGFTNRRPDRSLLIGTQQKDSPKLEIPM